MKRKYIRPTTIFTQSKLLFHVLESTPVMPYNPEIGTEEALTKDENRWEDDLQDDGSWGEGIW